MNSTESITSEYGNSTRQQWCELECDRLDRDKFSHRIVTNNKGEIGISRIGGENEQDS